MGVVEIAAGGEFSLAVREDGTVWAWGINEAYQLGNKDGDSSVPVQVIGLSKIVGIGAGGFHSLAVREDGSGWGWGGNTNGQLGIGLTGSRYDNPQRIRRLTGVIALSGAEWHSLALVAFREVP